MKSKKYNSIYVYRVIIYMVLLTTLEAISFARVSEPEILHWDTISFSRGPNLFIDDYLIAESKGLTRTTHQPEKLPQPIILEGIQASSFVKVLYDPYLGYYRMWYNLFRPALGYAYAESKDGINWNLPDLEMVEISGAGNYIDAPMGNFGLFMIDEGPGLEDSLRRYKLAYYSSRGMSLAFSSDGMRFEEYIDNPVIPAFDPKIPKFAPGSNLINDIIDGCWDPLKEEYLIGFKIEQSGFPGKPLHIAEGQRRLVGMSTSKDFITWAKSRVIVLPDPDNGLEEFYGFTPMVRGNLYIGFLRVLRDDLPATPGGPVEGIGWTELLTSRDGINWDRHQEKFMDRDHQPGTWDHAMAWYADGITVGDKEFIYYGGYRAGHKVRSHPYDRSLGMGFLRKNGFVSRDAGSEGGLLKTPMAALPGYRLTVNANVREELRVRLVDDHGNTLPGFGWNNCIPVRGNSVSHSVEWRNNPELPQDIHVSIEFSMRNAELFSFEFD